MSACRPPKWSRRWDRRTWSAGARRGKESWVYDKIATEASYKNSNSNVGATVGAAGVPGDVLLLGTVSGARGSSKGSSATTQKTLTVIIRFDANDTVESFSYHTSTF